MLPALIIGLFVAVARQALLNWLTLFGLQIFTERPCGGGEFVIKTPPKKPPPPPEVAVPDLSMKSVPDDDRYSRQWHPDQRRACDLIAERASG